MPVESDQKIFFQVPWVPCSSKGFTLYPETLHDSAANIY